MINAITSSGYFQWVGTLERSDQAPWVKIYAIGLALVVLSWQRERPHGKEHPVHNFFQNGVISGLPLAVFRLLAFKNVTLLNDGLRILLTTFGITTSIYFFAYGTVSVTIELFRSLVWYESALPRPIARVVVWIDNFFFGSIKAQMALNAQQRLEQD